MGDLKYRERVAVTLDKKVMEYLRRLSAETDIPVCRLIERAVMDKYPEAKKT